MNENKQIVYDELDLKVNNLNIIQHLIKIDENCFFIDVDILKKCYISYEDIVFVDLIVIDALMLLLSSIKNDYYMLVDVYKAGKESYELIEKFYKLYNNETFKTLVVLNYNRLYNMCLKTKQKIKDLICFFEIDAQNICDIIRKIKTYAKEDDDILAYLYLYNIFNV